MWGFSNRYKDSGITLLQKSSAWVSNDLQRFSSSNLSGFLSPSSLNDKDLWKYDALLGIVKYYLLNYLLNYLRYYIVIIIIYAKSQN